MRTKRMTTHFLSALAVVFFIFLAFGSSDEESNTNADGTPKTERQIQLEKQFSAWDGSHIELTKIIKKSNI
jgi:hypothetical protein